MLEESVKAVKDTNIKIFGVTALTSLADEDTKLFIDEMLKIRF